MTVDIESSRSKGSPLPWHDVPIHVGPCTGPLVTRAEHHRGGEYAPSVRLVCLACGDGLEGTNAEVAQAERARDAWATERTRCGT